MTTETARLVIAVDSSGAKSATRELDNLSKGSQRAEKATSGLTTAFRVLSGVISVAALTRVTGAYIQMADASANMSARLRLATKSQNEFNTAHRETYAIAQRTSTQLESVVDLYAKLSQSTGQLGVSQSSLLRLTESITQTFQISGATSQEAAGGLRQLSQAMAGGVLRAEEFNSIIESSPRLVQALADGMGIAFGDVRKHVNDGKISSEQLVNALLSQSAAIQREFDQMPLTVGRATQQVRNALQQLVGDTDNAEGASRDLATAIAELARTLESDEVKSGFASLVGGITSIAGAAAEAMAWLARLDAKVKESLGLAGNGPTRNAGAQDVWGGWRAGISALMGGDIDGARMGQSRMLEGLKGIWNNSGQVANFTGVTGDVLRPDFSGVTGSVTGSGIPKPRASVSDEDQAKARKAQIEAEKEWLKWMEEVEAHEAHAAASRMERTNELLRQAEAEEEAREQAAQGVRDLISDMEFERSLIGMTNVQREQAIALRYAGAAATQEERDRIRELVAEMEQAREAEGYVMDAKRGLGDLFATIGQGSDAATAAIDRMFDRLKQRAMDALADKAIDSLMAGFAGMMGGGGWAGFAQGFAGAWSGVKSGKAFGGPVQAGHAYRVGERGEPELFVPNTSGRVVPMGQGGMQRPVINLNVIGGQGTPETRTTPNAQGGFDIDVIFKQIEGHIAGGIASGSGSTYAAVKGRFALRDAV